MTDLNDLRDDSPSKLGRRKVVAGTAWAVPIVMGVGAAPAMATSSILTPSATYSAATSRVTFTVNVTGWKTGDSVSVSISPGGMVFYGMFLPGQSPLGSRPLTGNTMSWTGLVNTVLSTQGSYTVTFVVSSSNPTRSFTATATLTY